MTTRADLLEMIEAAVVAATWPVPSAARRGRDPRFPYVPVLRHYDPVTDTTRTEQVLGVAFASRVEALEYAERTVEGHRRSTVKRLADPRNRSMRESYGLPREVV